MDDNLTDDDNNLTEEEIDSPTNKDANRVLIRSEGSEGSEVADIAMESSRAV